ncbi:response regulator transcription factor [Haloarcula salina]|uniref:response regulator transcription factor n=1 Tax=Haloarcula salina TaxID=1429914 RepID=UPI003C6F5CB7
MGTSTRVALVDDDSDYRQLYRLWLPERYDVIEAADGREALELVDGSVDVVILDREMPNANGETVATELRDRSIDPAVVMVSSLEPGVDILDVPVDSYLTKPASRDALLSVISTIRSWREYGPERRDLLGLAARTAAVSEAKRAVALAESEAYRRAEERLAAHQLDPIDLPIER